jgi:hypothetical protein
MEAAVIGVGFDESDRWPEIGRYIQRNIAELVINATGREYAQPEAFVGIVFGESIKSGESATYKPS